MPTKKKAVKKAAKNPEPTLAERMAEKTKAAALAHRKKRERVHKGLEHANKPTHGPTHGKGAS